MNAPFHMSAFQTAEPVATSLASLILNLEPRVRNLVHWGDAFTTLGTAGTCPQPEALYVMGLAMHAEAQAVADGWEKAFALSRPRDGTGPEKPASSDLLQLVCRYEATHAALDAENDRLERVGYKSPEARRDGLVRACGQLRGEIASWPARTMPDVMLKLRAFAYGSDAASEALCLRDELRNQEGHGYLADVASGIANDLLAMREAGLCG